MLAQENPVMMPSFLRSPDWSGVPAFKVNTKPYVTQVYMTVMLRVFCQNRSLNSGIPTRTNFDNSLKVPLKNMYMICYS